MALVAAVLLTGFGSTWALASSVNRNHQERLGELLDRRTEAVGVAVRSQVARYTDTISDLAVAVGAQDHLTTDDFATLTSSITRARLPGASGVGLVVTARVDQLAAVQKTWRDAGNSDLSLRPAGTATEHLYLVLNTSLDGTPAIAGRDLSEADEPAEALAQARSTGQVTASRTYILLRDRMLPTGNQQMSFVLTTPVYAGIGTSDAGKFRGWILMGLRGGDFITETLREAAQDTVAVTLADRASQAGGLPMASTGTAVPHHPPLSRELTVDLGGRQWLLVVRPAQGFAPDEALSQAAIATISGVAFTLLLGTLISTLTWSRGRALDKVERATAELRSDIETREQVELRLRERERELEAFAGVVAHDLKAPLNTVAGYSGVLSDDYGPDLDDDARHYLAKIKHSTQRMRNLIDDLLSYASALDITMDRQPVDLAGLVADVLADHRDDLAEAPQVELGELPTVIADRVLLRQVLHNLIGNAIKYVRPGVVPQIVVRAEPTADGWMIEIRDNGIGIDDRDQTAVFDTFHRARGSEGYTGTGLGLAICRRVIERHHGQIGLVSKAGSGSRFWFTLPGTADAPERPAPIAASEPAPAPEPGPSAGRILLIEDDADDVFLGLRTLAHHGFDDVAVAGDGISALDLLLPPDRRTPLSPALVLLDLNLPGLDGFQILERLRADPRTNGLPVMVFVATDEDAERIVQLHPTHTGCLHKPLTIEQFDTLSSTLGLRWAVRQH